jgi:hypothetical protein
MTQTSATQIRLERRSPSYWRVTFDIPPLNIFGPKNIPQLNEIIALVRAPVGLKNTNGSTAALVKDISNLWNGE